MKQYITVCYCQHFFIDNSKWYVEYGKKNPVIRGNLR